MMWNPIPDLPDMSKTVQEFKHEMSSINSSLISTNARLDELASIKTELTAIRKLLELIREEM